MTIAELTIERMEFRERILRECKRRGWGPYELWQAVGGQAGDIKKQTIYAWFKELPSRGEDASGETYTPQLREKNLQLVAKAVGLDLRPVEGEKPRRPVPRKGKR